jgi:glycosyltransferase involved in cell wall biosynthesis
LVELLGKFPSKLIQFPGRKKPSEIFSSNQLIIHPSISPEPFGRVIIEGMKARIPVISSFIGGAAELRPKNNPLQFFPHDYQGLFSLIKKMSLNPSEKNSVIIDQLSVVNYIEGQIESTVKEFKKC